MLEDRLNKALDEAWLKVNDKLAMGDHSSDSERSTRMAAEAVEYSSALFSLTHGLEDFDPAIRLDKNSDPLTLVKNAVQELRKARQLSQASTRDAYTNLRAAADHLKVAYLCKVKKKTNRPS